MYSMTGFARATNSFVIGNKTVTIEVQLKSINAKGCEVQVRAPSLFSVIETDIIKYLKNTFKRGTLSCSLWVHGISSQKPFEISYDVATRYYENIEKLRNTLSIKVETTLHDILAIPGVMVAQEAVPNGEPYYCFVNNSVELAASLLDKELAREGGDIEVCISSHIATIYNLFARLRKKIISGYELRKKKLNAKALEIVEPLPIGDALSVELFRQIEKYDLSEEVQRFESHLNHLKELTESSVREKGRHGDFILQELFREVGTMGAKCNDSVISQGIIMLKMELEKIREQLCNVA